MPRRRTLARTEPIRCPRESRAARRHRAARILERLDAAFPEAGCALRYASPFQLLVATILSAQTTDAAVNRVTPALFAAFPTPEALAAADETEIGAHIRTLGLWRSKARNLKRLARWLVSEYGGQVPRTLEELTALPGVGKKTATAVLGEAYGIAAGVTVDTHMLRINRRLCLSTATDADRMAAELEALLPRDHWIRYTHQIIELGRTICTARRPACDRCPLVDLCPNARRPELGYRPEP